MASLTLRASLTFVAHRDRVLSSLAIVSPACLPSRLPHNARGSCTHHGMKVAYAGVYGVLQGSALEVAHHSKDPNPGGSCIHANCIVASLWTHEDRQETTCTY